VHTDIVTVNHKNQDFYSLKNLANVFNTDFHHLHRNLRTILKKQSFHHFESQIFVVCDHVKSRKMRGRPRKDVFVPIEIGDLMIARLKTMTSVKEGQNCYVIAFQNGTKVGCTNDLITRLKTYERPWCQPIIASHEYDSEYSYELESFLKHHFSKYTKFGVKEFFYGVSLEMVRNAADSFLQSKETKLTIN